MNRFLLQAIDPMFGCSVLEAQIIAPDLEVLRRLLGADADDDPNVEGIYTLDPDEVRAVTRHFDTAFDLIGSETVLCRSYLDVRIPYLVHTNNELFLMLDGRKPFATFSIAYPMAAGEDSIEVLFEPHVQAGSIVKRIVMEEFVRPIQGYRGRKYDGTRHLYYALPGEEWRIDANLLLWRQLRSGRWIETMERIWGSLLGYTESQNDWWITHLRQESGTNWGLDTAYAVIDVPTLEWLRASSCRVLPWAVAST